MKLEPGSWEKVPLSELREIRGVCLDIDETLSTRGKLTAEAYAALWKLKAAGFFVVPITGRPAGWCDQIARFWPVDAVVGENGAFAFYMESGRRNRWTSPEAPAEPRARIEALAEKVRREFPGVHFASDQAYREYDLAIDFCEDVPAWPRSEVDRLVRLCESAGAHAKVSSIHVNAWFGDYEKFTGFSQFLVTRRDTSSLWPEIDRWIFIGDSPNDEPLFAKFRHSVGVANLAEFADRLRFPPRSLTRAESGAGFVEMAERLLVARLGLSESRS